MTVEDYEPRIGAEAVERHDAVVLTLPEDARKLTTLRRFKTVGNRARESVRQRFLLTRLIEDWLDLIASFSASFRLRGGVALPSARKAA